MWEPSDPTRHAFVPKDADACWWCSRPRSSHVQAPPSDYDLSFLITVDPRTGLVSRREP